MSTPKPVTKQGQVAIKNRKYYVQIGRTQKEIPIGALVSAVELRKLVGQTVPVTIVGKSVVAIGRRPGILCYIPADPFLSTLVQPALQRTLQQQYVAAGILSAEDFAEQ